MAERFTEAGGTILKNTGAESVKRDGDGWRITAKDKEGELEILAKALIITTGGFGGNRELMYKYFPDQYDDNYYTDAILHTGDGLKLAEDAGVALTDYCTIIKENAYSTTSYKDAPNRAAHEPRSLWVNGYGERFCDETNAMDNLSTNALVRQPGKVGYAMFDSDIMEYTSTHRPAMMPEGLELPNVRLQFEEEVRRNGNEWAIISDSLDEIAHWIGADRDVFEETVEKYNSDCEAGRDSLFAKEPQYLMPLKKAPYYAIKFRPILIDTVGPIVVDEKMQALGDDHRPVPGVYAAGVITSGWQGVDYTLHGSALCYSLTSGRMAGASAAKYLSK
jgi:fumarate reductase flavoprotein subunit